VNRQQHRVRPEQSVHPEARDRGTVLVIVLVLMIVVSLIVLPIAQYGTSVLKANTVLSNKTKRIEAVKSGLRVSLAEPTKLYEACGAGGPTVAVNLASTTTNNIGVTTKCYFIDYQTAQAANELRYGLTTTRTGATPPTELRGKSYVAAAPSTTRTWWSATTKASQTDKIWLPDLPTHGLNRRSSTAGTMPAGYATCKVYFPGTYLDPVVLDGPTYFASGVYYFENEVRVVGGADVVVGLGATAGCTTDQEAIFYSSNPPGTHNMTGLGATWVFGGKGRLLVSNATGGPISMKFNSRYTADASVGSAAGVSIMSVNGQLAADGTTVVDLDAPGVIEVPASVVGGATPTPPKSEDYRPSVLTPKPVVPEAPTGVTAQRFVGAATVSWTAPTSGGSPITSYVVTASTGAQCTTTGATSCAIVGLPSSSITFTVVAQNAVGNSLPSAPSAAVTPGGSTSLAQPTQPARPTAVAYRRSARVSWTAPSNGGAPITGYTVTASPGGSTCSVDARVAAPNLWCDITGLDPLTLYTFTVTATNVIGASTASSPSTPGTLPALALVDPPAVVPPAAGPYDPTPIIEFAVPGTAAVTVSIPGYVAIPQGRLKVDNPRGHSVSVAGGVLAAQFSVADGRGTGPQTVPIGFLESVVQRKFRIVSTTSVGRETSTAVVQVNQNGAYAVNSWEVQ
jgi:hypothetical protein